jgi:hypothetical protein
MFAAFAGVLRLFQSVSRIKARLVPIARKKVNLM